MGRAQQMMMEHLAQQLGEATEKAAGRGPGRRRRPPQSWPGMSLFGDPAKLMEQQAQLWTEGLGIWQRALAKATGGAEAAQARRRRWPRKRTATGASRRRNGGTIRSSTRSARPIC